MFSATPSTSGQFSGDFERNKFFGWCVGNLIESISTLEEVSIMSLKNFLVPDV